jgi:hypothetical protein
MANFCTLAVYLHYGSGSLKIVDIYYEKNLTLIEFVSLGKVLNDIYGASPLK